MAHLVETMLYVGETPWHRLGVKLDAPPTAEEAIKAAGLDWEVGLKGLRTDDGESVDHRASYRISDGSILGVVGPGWYPLQNKDAFAWFNPFLQAKEATIECAGSLKQGKRVWILAKLARDPSIIVPGDEIQKYILLANGHDGVFAGRVGFTPIRVLCNNTLSAAVDSDDSQLVKVQHRKNIVVTLEKVRDIMNAADACFEATAEQYRTLAKAPIDTKDLERYVKLVFNRVKKAERGASKAPTIVELANSIAKEVAVEDAEDKAGSRQLEAVTELFETGKGNNLPGVKGTYWAAYNAVTEFTTHVRGRSDENRLAAQFADGGAINRRALTTALALAA